MDTVQKLGVLVDPRDADAKEFDYTHQELYTSSVPEYLPGIGDASKYVGVFPAADQKQTSSCVAHGKVQVLSIFNYLQTGTFTMLSPMFLYRNRINYPTPGMVPSSANLQTIKSGAPIYADMQTPQTEAEANVMQIDAATTKAAKLWAAGKWVKLMDPTDIDTIAFVSNSLNLPLNILIYGTYAEWAKDVVKIEIPGLTQADPRAVVEHCVTVLPHSAYIGGDGRKYVIIQDSAHFGGFIFRSVEEGFIAERCTESSYMIAMGNAPIVSKPIVNLQSDLIVGSKGQDVLALQGCLQYLGYFPNSVNGQKFLPTGYFGGMTKNSVMKLQNEYASEILTPAHLMAGTGVCGLSTRTFLNKLFI